MKRLRALLGAFALLAAGAVGAQAADVPGAQAMCNNAGLFSQGRLLTGICYKCFFPISVGGVPMGAGDVPWSADKSPTCTCPGRFFGTPTMGPVLGMWLPTHLVELTRMPGCSPSLEGAMLPGFGAGAAARGTWGAMRQNTADPVDKSTAFYNAHLIQFPIGKVIDMVVDAVCVGNMAEAPNVAYISEIDPFWANDSLALHTVPEAVLFSSPPAVAACIADAVSASTPGAQPLDALFWCAGSFGHLYPFHGVSGQDGASPPRETSLIASKFLAALTRRTIMPLTMGPTAVCVNHPTPVMLKSQYKMAILHPIPEIQDNHWIGETPMKWGEWRNVPGIGEDFVNLIWNYEQCCANP